MSNINYRYERKFQIEGLSAFDAEVCIKNNIGFFNEIYKPRYINNIYFDYNNFTNFRDNVDGNFKRKKPRIRWYGDLFGEINECNLEYKIKLGFLGTKLYYKLKQFQFSNDSNLKKIKNNVLCSIDKPNDRENFINQHAVLVNRYKRRYYQSFDRKYRITIDTNLNYYLPINNCIYHYPSDKINNIVLIELKYSKEYEKNAHIITNRLPFRISRFSKYTVGVQHLYNLTY